MNTVETHALLAHLPLAGSVLGIFILIFGLLTRSYRTQMAGHLLLVITATAAFFAFMSGSDLQYNMKNPLADAQSGTISHTDFALYSIIVLGCLGILSLSALWLNLKNSVLVKTITPVVIATALISFAVIAYTGYLGIQIRKGEAKNNLVPQTPASQKDVAVSITGK